MTLSKVHARLVEEKKKLNPVDGRRFNSRSHEKMEREIRMLQRNVKSLVRKSAGTKHLHRGMYSSEEVAFANEEKKKFREACSMKMAEKVNRKCAMT